MVCAGSITSSRICGIRNDKIWVEADNSNAQIVQQLLDCGVPREAIVLAFYSPQKRSLTEFAVA